MYLDIVTIPSEAELQLLNEVEHGGGGYIAGWNKYVAAYYREVWVDASKQNSGKL